MAETKLLPELQKLYRAYVSMLELGRERIIDLGGTCDTVETMEDADPALRSARAAIAAWNRRSPLLEGRGKYADGFDDAKEAAAALIENTDGHRLQTGPFSFGPTVISRRDAAKAIRALSLPAGGEDSSPAEDSGPV